MDRLTYIKHDGGRRDAGFKGASGDCVTRAIAIALDLPYRKTYNELGALSSEMTGGLESSVRDGCPTAVHHCYLTHQQWTLTLLKDAYFRTNDIPMTGRIIVASARHLVAVINGTVLDSWDSRMSNRTKNGRAKVFGYYSYGAI